MHEHLTTIAAIVLAAGKGTRMKSELPKVLHKVCGTPMIGRVLKTLRSVGLDKFCVVVGGDIPRLEAYMDTLDIPLTLTAQTERLGTGEAVACAGFGFADTAVPTFARGHFLQGNAIKSDYVLICAGDTPALKANILSEFLSYCKLNQSLLAVLAMDHPQPFGYGRIIQDSNGQLTGIVEEKDANPDQRRVTLCNSGVIFANRKHLFDLLAKLKPLNAQGEYYLTDCFELSKAAGKPAHVFVSKDFSSFDGVNNREQLVHIETKLQTEQKLKWMQAGVTFRLPDSTYIEDSVQFGADCEIGPQCTLLGTTTIGEGSEIGSHVVLKDVNIPPGTVVPAGTVRV